MEWSQPEWNQPESSLKGMLGKEIWVWITAFSRFGICSPVLSGVAGPLHSGS